MICRVCMERGDVQVSGMNKVTLGYQEYKSYVKTNKGSRLANRSYSMELGSTQNNERLLDNTTYVDIDTNTMYEWKAEYDDNFTSDTPYIKVTVSGEDRMVKEYIVNIDEVDVSAASDIELFALCSYADAHEKNSENVKSSWELIRGYINDDGASKSYGQKRDWLTMVGEAKEECLKAKLYKQVADGNKLTHLLEKYGMTKEVEMIRINANTLVPVDNGIKVQDVDGGYAQVMFENKGTIRYVNHLNSGADWTMEVSQEMLKKAEQIGSEFAVFMSDKMFWENFLNGDMSIDELKASADYKAIRSGFLDHLPESVKQAWEHAAAETGIDGLGIAENGELLYPSELVKQYMLAKLKGESTEFCGYTMDTVMEFAKRTLVQLQDAHQPKYNAETQKLKDKEKLFYQSFIKNLT